MLSSARKMEWFSDAHYLGPAKVVKIELKENDVCVRLIGNPGDNEVWATLAVPWYGGFNVGDTVLVIGDSDSGHYVIGLMKDQPARVATTNGAYATTDETSLKVYSNTNQLLFDYDSQVDCATLQCPSGGIEFESAGDIRFKSDRNISLQGQQVQISGRSQLQLNLLNTFGKLAQAIHFSPGRIGLKSQEVEITAQRSTIRSDDMRLLGKRFRGIWGRADIMVDRLETISHSVLIKTRNLYTTVEKLSQLTTGRMRTLIKGTLHMKSRRAYLRSDEDYKINADKIHLG